jgi:hypothetical protein
VCGTTSQFGVGQLFITVLSALFPLRMMRVIMILVDSQHHWRGIGQWRR